MLAFLSPMQLSKSVIYIFIRRARRKKRPFALVEITGIEPVTSGLQSRRSPN